MTEAFAVFGAVVGAFGILNLARQFLQSLIHTVQEYGEAGATVIELSDSFESFMARLEVWAQQWNLTKSTPEEFYIALWSKKGWESISRQLAFIENRSEIYTSLLATTMSSEDLQKIETKSRAADASRIQSAGICMDADISGVLGYHTRTSRNHIERIKVKLAQRSMTPISKAKLVLSNATQLSTCLELMKAKFTELDRDSSNFYTVTYPSSTLNVSITDRHETAMAKVLMQHALDTRDSSEALYQACLTLKHQAQDQGLSTLAKRLRRSERKFNLPSLEMNLSLREIGETSEAHQRMPAFQKLHYHLLIPWPKSETRLEILVEGPVQADGGQERDCSTIQPPDSIRSCSIIQDFKHACALVESRKTCKFQTNLESISNTNANALWFRLTSPSEPIHGLRQINLSKWLNLVQAKTSAESHERFPLRERLDLAYNVAECGLLLLGTSWLSNLSSKNIQRFSGPGREPRQGRERHRRFLLETKDLNNEDLASVEPQTFNVGVLLTEIAIAQPVLYIKKYESTLGSELHLVMASLHNYSLKRRSLPAHKVVERVNNHMGQGYSRAVEFCLQQSQIRKSTAWQKDNVSREWKVRDQAYRVILRDYYQEVFLP